MALKIIWTEQARIGLINVIRYLEKKWTKKEIAKLETNIEKAIDLLKVYPESCPISPKNKQLRKVVVDKNNYMVYKFDKIKQYIIIINFRGTKQL